MLKKYLYSFLILLFISSCGDAENSQPTPTCIAYDCPFEISFSIIILNEIFIWTCLDPIENSTACEKPDPYVTIEINDKLSYQTPVYVNTTVIEFDKLDEDPPSFEAFINETDVFKVKLIDHNDNSPDTTVITCTETISQEILNKRRAYCRIPGLNHIVVLNLQPLR